MTCSAKIKELRKQLLEKCDYAINRLEAAKERVTFASNNKKDTTTSTSSPGADKSEGDTTTNTSLEKKSESDTNYEFTDSEIMDSFMELTHGVLIQEWEHFLYNIFVEGIIYYVRGYDLGDITHKLGLKNLKPTLGIVEMRKSVSAEIERSHLGYERLFDQSRKLFKVKVSELLQEEMNQQVLIRHIFQHNGGEIRSRDIKKNGNKAFLILDNKGKSHPYGKGKEIPLSGPEIRKLYTVIEEYSEAFQIQAEKTQHITSTLSH